MRKLNTILIVVMMILSFSRNLQSQNCNNLNLQMQSSISSTCNLMVMTMVHDANNQPYLYVANKEAGLTIYDISVLNVPIQTGSISTLSFDTLDVMSLTQYGNYLYLALGNSFTSPQSGGMAIVDVSNPLLPVVTDYFVVAGSGSGGGIVKVEGNFAYLGAMESGLIVFDVTDKNNIQFVSQFVPDITYPPVINPNPNLYNARGMEVKDGIVYLCYDAGGIRIINCTNANAPVETGRWCNPVMYTPLNHPKAYNNCILNDTLLYVTVDYAGLEILNVSDTGNITLTGWWNPYNAPNNNWFTSPGHTNEIQFDPDCHVVFVSSGASDMHVIDVSDPALPDSCNFYGGTANNRGAWGVGRWQNQVYLSYVCAVIPFSSNWTGVEILTYNPCNTGLSESNHNIEVTIAPNPISDQLSIYSNRDLSNATVNVLNILGEQITRYENITGKDINLHLQQLPRGIYFIQVYENSMMLANDMVVIAY